MKSKLIIFFILLGLQAYSIDSITHVFGTNESTICRSLDTINCVIFGYLENQQNLDYVDKGELEILNKDFDNIVKYGIDPSSTIIITGYSTSDEKLPLRTAIKRAKDVKQRLLKNREFKVKKIIIRTEIDSYPKDINIRRVNIRGVYIDILDPKKMKFT